MPFTKLLGARQTAVVLLYMEKSMSIKRMPRRFEIYSEGVQRIISPQSRKELAVLLRAWHGQAKLGKTATRYFVVI